MFHTVYKTTNVVNGMYYIGYHKTSSIHDSYLGSGKYFLRAVKLHGKHNFKKEILAVLDTRLLALILEEELVAKEKGNQLCYNLKSGGEGGFDYINEKRINNSANNQQKAVLGRKALLIENPNLHKEQYRKFLEDNPLWLEKAKVRLSFYKGSFKGRKHNHASRLRMSLIAKNQGRSHSNNSQYDTCWINNGKEAKKIKKSDINLFVANGWFRGRIGFCKRKVPLNGGQSGLNPEA